MDNSTTPTPPPGEPESSGLPAAAPSAVTAPPPPVSATSGARPAAAPPPLTPPPLATAVRPPPPPGRGGGWGWKAAVVVLGVLLLLMVAAGSVGGWVLHWVGSSAGEPGEISAHLEEVVVETDRTEAKLAVIDVEGIIFGGMLGGGQLDPVQMLREQLKRAEKDDAVKGVILRIDSPGGEVLAADEMYRRIDEFQGRTGKPVIASMGSVAASGGYYVAAPCRWIVANPLTITGSIGVIMHGYNYRGLMDKVGVRPEVYKSGRFKDMMSGDKTEEAILPEERKMLQALVDETFGRFKQVVGEGRQKSNRLSNGEGRVLATDWEEYTDGRIFSGKQAHDWGFVDELGDFQAAVKRAKALLRIDRAKLIRYEQPFELGNLFRLFAKSEARSLKIDLGLDLPPLEAGRLYFIFLPGVH